MTWVQGSIFYTDGENSDISNPLVGWQLARNKFLIFLWMCLFNNFFPPCLFCVFNAFFLCALMIREDKFSSFFVQWRLHFFSIYNKTSCYMWPNMQKSHNRTKHTHKAPVPCSPLNLCSFYKRLFLCFWYNTIVLHFSKRKIMCLLWQIKCCWSTVHYFT